MKRIYKNRIQEICSLKGWVYYKRQMMSHPLNMKIKIQDQHNGGVLNYTLKNKSRWPAQPNVRISSLVIFHGMYFQVSSLGFDTYLIFL